MENSLARSAKTLYFKHTEPNSSVPIRFLTEMGGGFSAVI